MHMRMSLKVCTIGGGSGMPMINKGLIRAGIRNIRSIVTTFDSGGDTGRMRTDERGKILAFSDYWRSLISLWQSGDQKKVWEEMLRYKDGRGRNFGNTFFQFMSEKAGSLGDVDSLFTSLTGARLFGEVIPVSTDPANVCFKTISDKKYCGEHNLDDLRMSKDKVIKIWLEPEIKVNEEAKRALIESDLIIICPGSMFGSVLVNFLPIGFKEAFRESKAKKILMTNIMSVVSENNNFNQDDYVSIFSDYLETNKPFDLVVMADLSKFKKELIKKVLFNYDLEHSSPIEFNKNSSCLTQVVDIATIDEDNLRLRHSERKLGDFFTKLEV